MAAGNFTPLNIAKKKIGDGTFDMDSHGFALALTTSSQVIDATFAGTSTDARYSDLTAEASNGNGYTTGGVALTSVVWSRTTGTVTFDAADIMFLALTKTVKYAVIYDTTDTNKSILGFVDLEALGGSITLTGQDFNIIWNASGIFTLS